MPHIEYNGKRRASSL